MADPPNRGKFMAQVFCIACQDGGQVGDEIHLVGAVFNHRLGLICLDRGGLCAEVRRRNPPARRWRAGGIHTPTHLAGRRRCEIRTDGHRKAGGYPPQGRWAGASCGRNTYQFFLVVDHNGILDVWVRIATLIVQKDCFIDLAGAKQIRRKCASGTLNRLKKCDFKAKPIFKRRIGDNTMRTRPLGKTDLRDDD